MANATELLSSLSAFGDVYFMCIEYSASVYVCAPFVCLVFAEARRAHGSREEWVDKTWRLRTEPVFSAGAASTPNPPSSRHCLSEEAELRNIFWLV